MEVSQKLIIIGAGGHARVITDIIRCLGDEIVGFLDDRDDNAALEMNVLGRIDDVERFTKLNVRFIIGIGKNEIRETICNRLKVYCLPYYSAIHPSSVIAKDVEIGLGTVIMANAVVNTGSRVGCHCIVNTAATIDHDNVISDFVHLSPGVHLSGSVRIGTGTWLGTGAIVINNVSICNGCTIGAGAVVTKDITIPGTYVGVPARSINEQDEL